MKKTKLWFGLLILFFISIFAVSPLIYHAFVSNYDSIGSYPEPGHKSCHITITEPTIILRIDDVRAYSVPTHYLIDEVLKRNMSVVLGVIPKGLSEDNSMVNYLNSIKKNKNVEIAQHGYTHELSDENITDYNLLMGRQIIIYTLRIFPVTYIPPFNAVSSDTMNILKKHFDVISINGGKIKEGEASAEIDQMVETYNYDKGYENSIAFIIAECRDNIEKYNICVVTIHPQEFSTKDVGVKDLDKEKFEEFKRLLDSLQSLHARFSTFHDLVNCQS